MLYVFLAIIFICVAITIRACTNTQLIINKRLQDGGNHKQKLLANLVPRIGGGWRIVEGGVLMCPDCGNEEFFAGAEGGICINIKCTACGSAFNYTRVMNILTRIPSTTVEGKVLDFNTEDRRNW